MELIFFLFLDLIAISPPITLFRPFSLHSPLPLLLLYLSPSFGQVFYDKGVFVPFHIFELEILFKNDEVQMYTYIITKCISIIVELLNYPSTKAG